MTEIPNTVLQIVLPTSEQIKEVYARFGAAYYFAECLYREVCHFYVGKTLDHNAGITRPRVEELLSVAYSKTLGQIVGEISPYLKSDEQGILNEAVDKRNFLAHHFWFERCHLLQSAAGVEPLISELTSYQNLFEFADQMLEQGYNHLRVALGISDDLVKAAMRELQAGIPLDPLPRVRKLQRNERIVHVWEFDAPSGKPLIFETADGLLWQLCDVGLGWSPYEKPASSWAEQTIISQHLPATIEPRPKCNAPWNYEFKLSDSATLWVKPGSKPRTFRWGIRKT